MRPLPKWHTHPNEPTSILIMMSTERALLRTPFSQGEEANLLLLHYHFGWSTVQNRRGKEVRSEEFRMGREERERGDNTWRARAAGDKNGDDDG